MVSMWPFSGHSKKGSNHGNAVWKIPSTSRRDTYADEVFNNFCSSLPKPEDERQARDHGQVKQIVGEFIYTTLTSFRQENNQLRSEIGQFKDDQAKADRNFQRSIDEERRQSRRLKEKNDADLQSIQRQYNHNLSLEQQRHKRELDDIIAKNAGNIQELRRNHAVDIQELKRNHAAAIEGLKQNHEGVRRWLDGQVSNLTANLATTQANAEQEKRDLIESHDASLGSLKAEHLNDKADLQRTHQSREEALAAQVEQLSAALLTRDDEMYTAKIFSISAIPQKSDEKLKGSFSEVVKAVDDLSRLAWRHDQPVFAEADLARLRGQNSDRLLKKAILQDLIWSCLYDFLFASPFRMCGEEGQQLEKEWVNQAGQGAPSDHSMYVWPDPGAQTERWRYMTLYQCREILVTPKMFEWDARARVKNGFGETLDKLAKTLIALTSQVAEMMPEARQEVESIAKKASRMWLDFGMQRCRIVVVLTGSGIREPAQRLAAIRQGGLTLTTSPRVGRFGNMKGADLGTFTIIGGCEGGTFETMS